MKGSQGVQNILQTFSKHTRQTSTSCILTDFCELVILFKNAMFELLWLLLW